MATQITWIIEWIKCKPAEGQYTDVVITAGWRCNGVNGGYTATSYSSTSFAGPGDPFTPYDQLTEQQVLDWCWADGGVNKAEVEATVEQKIQSQINPPVIQLPLPWAN